MKNRNHGTRRASMRSRGACALGAALALTFAAGTALAQETPPAPPPYYAEPAPPAPPAYYVEPAPPAPPPGYVVVPAPPPPPTVYSVAAAPPAPYQYRPGPIRAYGVEYGRPARPRGRWLWGPTMGALVMPEANRVGMSFGFFAFREVGDWGFGFDGRVASSNWQQDDGAQFTQASFGGRRYFGDANVSAFIGLGLSLSHMSEPGGTYTSLDSVCIFSCSTSTTSRRYDLSGEGAGAYGEVGIELFRDQPTRVMASIRVDAPFYSLATDDGVAPSDSAILSGATSRYELPITLSVGVGF